MTLHQKILGAARDEVAKKSGFDNWQQASNSVWHVVVNRLRDEAVLLAMERLDEFRYWAINNGWKKVPGSDLFWNKQINAEPTELELYEIFTTQQ